MKRAVLILFLLTLGPGCKTAVVQHPGSLDQFDSSTYDTLTVAQSILDSAKVSYLQGKLPESAKPIINKAGLAYNTLRDAWLGYRSAKDAIQKQNYIELVNAAIPAVNKFILDLKALGVK
jgi:hypothetical protein